MANFDVSFLNPKVKKASAGQGYSFLLDSLQIKENQLASDGNLSEGDYKLLADMGRKMAANPGLTATERGNLNVKVSSYEASASKDKLKKNQDITNMNNDLKTNYDKMNMTVSNDPAKFLEAKAYFLRNKVQQLSDSVNSMADSGQNYSKHYDEYISTVHELQDTLDAQGQLQNFLATGQPVTDFTAYVTTNSKGEVTDLKISRTGDESGYSDTNGNYGGFPLAGKARTKDSSGTKSFRIGNQTFAGTDSFGLGPNGEIVNKGTLTATGNGVDPTTGQNIPANPSVDLTQVRPQSVIDIGKWAKGSKGFFYQRQEDGSYKKYVNFDQQKLGIQDGDYISVPNDMEQNLILPNVNQPTVDGSVTPADATSSFLGPAPTNSLNIPIGDQGTPQGMPGLSEPAPPKGRPNTGGAPTVRSPDNSGGVFQQVNNTAKGFFASLFGK